MERWEWEKGDSQVYPMGIGHLKMRSMAPMWLLNFWMCSLRWRCISGEIRFLSLASEISLPSFQKHVKMRWFAFSICLNSCGLTASVSFLSAFSSPRSLLPRMWFLSRSALTVIHKQIFTARLWLYTANKRKESVS